MADRSEDGEDNLVANEAATSMINKENDFPYINLSVDDFCDSAMASVIVTSSIDNSRITAQLLLELVIA